MCSYFSNAVKCYGETSVQERWRPTPELRRAPRGQHRPVQALRVLREVGLVDVRGAGRQRMYRLNGQSLKPIHDWVKNYERTWNERFEVLDELLDELKGTEEGNGGNGE